MRTYIDPELIVELFEADIICDSGSLTGDLGDDDSGEVTPNSAGNDT